MAVALKKKRAGRGLEAVAERPDGTLIHFIPYPTPLGTNEPGQEDAPDMEHIVDHARKHTRPNQRATSEPPPIKP
jgi:hypothetical protein